MDRGPYLASLLASVIEGARHEGGRRVFRQSRKETEERSSVVLSGLRAQSYGGEKGSGVKRGERTSITVCLTSEERKVTWRGGR